MKQLNSSNRKNNADVTRKLIQSLSESEVSLCNYLNSVELMITSVLQRAANTEASDSTDELQPSFSAVGKSLDSISEFQSLLLKKAELLCKTYSGKRDIESALMNFLSIHRPEFEKHAAAIQRVTSNRPRLRRDTISILRNISKYSSQKGNLRGTLGFNEPTAPWITSNKPTNKPTMTGKRTRKR